MKEGVKSIGIKLMIFCLMVIEVYPLFWMLAASLKQQSEWTGKPAYILNAGFCFQNCIKAWIRGNMVTFFKNSFIYTVAFLFFIAVFTMTVSFAVTKMKWRLRGFIGKYFEFGIMVPVVTALIPLFQIYSGMGLLNNRLCLIITYMAFGLSLSILLTTGYLHSFLDKIMEAAVIDGCGVYKLMWYVVIPLMKNAIVTVLILQFFLKWNDLIFSMTFISDQKLKAVRTELLYFQNEFGAKNWGAIFASVSVCVILMLILYMILNRRVIEGMTASAVKG